MRFLLLFIILCVCLLSLTEGYNYNPALLKCPPLGNKGTSEKKCDSNLQCDKDDNGKKVRGLCCRTDYGGRYCYYGPSE